MPSSAAASAIATATHVSVGFVLIVGLALVKKPNGPLTAFGSRATA